MLLWFPFDPSPKQTLGTTDVDQRVVDFEEYLLLNGPLEYQGYILQFPWNKNDCKDAKET